jgi:hypothetical protein
MPATIRRARKTAKPADTEPTAAPTPDPADTPTGADTTGTPAPATGDQPRDEAPTEAIDAPTGDTSAPAPVSGAPVSGAPVSGAPVSGAPVGTGDHLKVVMVAGILGDHPDGVTAAAIVDESGLRAAIVARVLAAMETAGAAVRKPPADEGGPELWARGDADLTTVDLSRAAVREVCPTCNRPMPRRNTVSVSRIATGGQGLNGDGQRTLGKNELRNLVRDFLHANPGHEFTPLTISRELGRSSGAIQNALHKLALAGEAVLVKEAPATFTALADTAGPSAEK